MTEAKKQSDTKQQPKRTPPPMVGTGANITHMSSPPDGLEFGEACFATDNQGRMEFLVGKHKDIVRELAKTGQMGTEYTPMRGSVFNAVCNFRVPVGEIARLGVGRADILEQAKSVAQDVLAKLGVVPFAGSVEVADTAETYELKVIQNLDRKDAIHATDTKKFLRRVQTVADDGGLLGPYLIRSVYDARQMTSARHTPGGAPWKLAKFWNKRGSVVPEQVTIGSYADDTPYTELTFEDALDATVVGLPSYDVREVRTKELVEREEAAKKSKLTEEALASLIAQQGKNGSENRSQSSFTVVTSSQKQHPMAQSIMRTVQEHPLFQGAGVADSIAFQDRTVTVGNWAKGQFKCVAGAALCTAEKTPKAVFQLGRSDGYFRCQQCHGRGGEIKLTKEEVAFLESTAGQTRSEPVKSTANTAGE